MWYSGSVKLNSISKLKFERKKISKECTNLTGGKYHVALPDPIQCVPQKRKPINRVNFSENCDNLSEKAYIFTKFSLSSFF